MTDYKDNSFSNQLWDIKHRLLSNKLLVNSVSVLLHIAAVTFLVMLPDDTRKTYISEKNLQCGVEPGYNHTEAIKALNFADQLRSRFPIRSFLIEDRGAENAALWIRDQLVSLRVETQLHYFPIAPNKQGINVVGILRAERSLGSDAIVLTTRYDQDIGSLDIGFESDTSGAIGLQLSLAWYLLKLGTETWQARDIIFVFTPEGGEVSGVDAWLCDYLSPSIPMMRAGNIFAAISIDNAGNEDFDRIIVSPEGLRGFLPNLDLVTNVVKTAFLQYQVAGTDQYSATEEVLGDLRRAIIFAWHTALSYPKSNHAPFTQFGVNAVGISSMHGQNTHLFIRRAPHVYDPSLQFEYNAVTVRSEAVELTSISLLKMGRVIEVALHNLFNADEQLHHSFRWYGMTSAVNFMETGNVARPLIPIIASLIVQLFSLFDIVHGMKDECGKSLGHFMAVLLLGVLLCCLPIALSAFSIIPGGLKPSEAHQLSTMLCVPLIYVFSVLVIYFVVLKPIAHRITSSFYGTVVSISWTGIKFWMLLYYTLVAYCCLLYNAQFGYFAIVATLPFMVIQPSSYIVNKLLMSLILLLSHPIPLLFILYGAYKTGPLWVLRVMVAFTNWGSLFWPFVTAVWVPLIITGLHIVWQNNAT